MSFEQRDAGKPGSREKNTVFIDEQHNKHRMKIFIFIMPIVCTSEECFQHTTNTHTHTHLHILYSNVCNTFARRVYFPCANRIPPQFRVVIHNKQFKFCTMNLYQTTFHDFFECFTRQII